MIIGIALSLLGCAAGNGALASFSENEVGVVIEWQQNPPALKASFTPLESGFHLYSKDLPPGGVEGIGRPTRLELAPGSPIQPAGPLQESVPAAADPLSSTSAPLLIYPPGPVTLTLPVSMLFATIEQEVPLSVSYMACSPQGICHAPVIGKLVKVKIPKP